MLVAESPCLADWLFSLADLAALGSPSLVVSFHDAFDIQLAREFAEPIPTASWRKFGYKYDFGDSWYVVLEVKGTSDQAAPLRMLAGDWAGPPDDFGGIETFNAYIAGEGDAEERRERRAWIKDVVGKWTPTGWQPEWAHFSLPHERLARMLAYDGDDELTPDPKGTPQERVDRFVRNNLDDIKPVIEDHLDGLQHWSATICEGKLYLIGRKPYEPEKRPDEDIRPEVWRRVPGRSPAYAIEHILERHSPYQTNPYQRLPYQIVALPSRHEVGETLHETIAQAFLAIYPEHPATSEFFNRGDMYIWRHVGAVARAAAAPAMRAAISAALQMHGTPVEQATRVLLLASFDKHCRSLLGLDDGEIIVPVGPK